MSRTAAHLRMILAMRCERATECLSQEQDEPLGRAELVAIRMHTMICRSCRRFRAQIHVLRTALRLRETARADEDGPGPLALRPEVRQRILLSLRAAEESGFDEESPP